MLYDLQLPENVIKLDHIYQHEMRSIFTIEESIVFITDP